MIINSVVKSDLGHFRKFTDYSLLGRNNELNVLYINKYGNIHTIFFLPLFLILLKKQASSQKMKLMMYLQVRGWENSI